MAWAIASLLVASCGSGENEKAKGGAAAAPQVGFVTVQASSVPVQVELAGRVTAFQTSEVRPQVAGVIRRRLFEEGAFVRAGQTLYEIDPRVYDAAVNEASANLASAQANAQAAQVRAERLRPLAKIEAVSQQDYTDAAAQARQTAAAVQQSRAQLETARVNLGFTRVPAPISGRIGRSLFTQGALVTTGQADPLAIIQRLDPIFVDIQQSSADLLALRRSLARDGIAPAEATVRLRLEDGSDYGLTGSVQFAEAMVNESTGTVTLRASFSNPNAILLPGMFVRASFAQSIIQRAILVPQAALQRQPTGEASVFVVGPDNKAVRRVVTADRTSGSNWVVTQGLKAGERVIVQGTGNLRPNQSIRPVPANSPQRVEAPKGEARASGDAAQNKGS